MPHVLNFLILISVTTNNTDTFDVDELVICYNETLESHAPLTTKTIVSRPYVPWFNTDVKSEKKSEKG